MAFISKSSKSFTQFKLRKYLNQVSILRHTRNNEASLYFSTSTNGRQQYYSTNSAKRILLCPSLGHSVKLPPFYFASHRYLSSDNSQDNIQVHATETLERNSNFASSMGESSSDKVLFVETPKFAETPPSSFESMSQTTDSSEFITDAAANVVMSSDLTSATAAVVEPSLSSLGLVNWTPVGLVEAILEYFHVSMGMSWWLSIVAATAIIRVLMLPIFIKAQKNASHMANYMPEMQFLQAKFTEARKTGNSYEASKASQELMDFMKKHNVNPLKNMLIPLCQAPVFISYFLALRAMAKVPVASMKTGGLWWITDLTVPDPYYIMPLVACSTLYIVLKVGAESGMRMDEMKLARYFFMAMPVIAFPFCINFESAVLFYWCTNNFMSLLLVLFMKIEFVRNYLGILKIKPPPKKFKPQKKGFIEDFKESIDNQRILSSWEDRRRIDSVQFRKAGTGPIPRTYSYDPTKPRPASAAAAATAKQRDTKS